MASSPSTPPAFLGTVFYVMDPNTEVPLGKYPPQLPSKGFRPPKVYKTLNPKSYTLNPKP